MINDIVEKVIAGQRLSFEDGMRLYRSHNILELATLADFVRQKKYPNNIVTFIISRNINYTNVCWVRCKFCAFYRPPGDEEGYVLSNETIFKKIDELLDLGGYELLMQGGLNPKLKIEYYEELFSSIKSRYKVHLHSLSPAEIIYIAKRSKLSLEETIKRLRAAGLDTIPGGGAEILVDEVREEIAPYKDTAEEWLEVMRTAHKLKMRTTATMMYGSVEKLEHRVEHLIKIRNLQDETGGFTAFIPWNFQPDGTELGGKKATGYDYLKTVAISRLMLDNVDNIQASWVTQGPKIAQISLKYGANDFGSTMIEENVVSAAGTKFLMSIQDIRRQIQEAGYEPKIRNTYYQIIGN